MPISSYVVIPEVTNNLIVKNPKTVLDVGIGNGLYGCIVKNYLPSSHIVGIEGFKSYDNPMWLLYDEVITEKAPEAFKNINKKFDAIIMCDVIEHFEEEEGLNVVEDLKKMLNKDGILIITTPSIFCKQGAVNGNRLEIHRSLWEAIPEFKALRESGPDEYKHYMQIFIYTR